MNKKELKKRQKGIITKRYIIKRAEKDKDGCYICPPDWRQKYFFIQDIKNGNFKLYGIGNVGSIKTYYQIGKNWSRIGFRKGIKKVLLITKRENWKFGTTYYFPFSIIKK